MTRHTRCVSIPFAQRSEIRRVRRYSAELSRAEDSPHCDSATTICGVTTGSTTAREITVEKIPDLDDSRPSATPCLELPLNDAPSNALVRKRIAWRTHFFPRSWPHNTLSPSNKDHTHPFLTLRVLIGRRSRPMTEAGYRGSRDRDTSADHLAVGSPSIFAM